MTSHDVVGRIRRASGQRRVGHAGTLDPLATGVLLVCVGQATRVVEYLVPDFKEYLSRFRLGITTDTYDSEGAIVRQNDANHVTRADIESGFARFTGVIAQVPPMFSAIKHKGTPLYRYARSGEVVDRAPRQVEIRTLRLVDWSPPEAEIWIECSKGTYIRSLIHDLGQTLGCGAHMVALRRMAIGEFRLEDSLALDEIERAFAADCAAEVLLPLDAALKGLPPVSVDAEGERRILRGEAVPLGLEAHINLCRAYSSDGRLLAILRSAADGYWHPHKVLGR